MDNVIVIGIAGGTGSGKSTLIKKNQGKFRRCNNCNQSRFLLQRTEGNDL